MLLLLTTLISLSLPQLTPNTTFAGGAIADTPDEARMDWESPISAAARRPAKLGPKKPSMVLSRPYTPVASNGKQFQKKM